MRFSLWKLWACLLAIAAVFFFTSNTRPVRHQTQLMNPGETFSSTAPDEMFNKSANYSFAKEEFIVDTAGKKIHFLSLPFVKERVEYRDHTVRLQGTGWITRYLPVRSFERTSWPYTIFFLWMPTAALIAIAVVFFSVFVFLLPILCICAAGLYLDARAHLPFVDRFRKDVPDIEE